jgi:N-(2-amino-2-carboxyethyl)-L-glutamate synthase
MKAFDSGLINKDTIIIESSSGNMGIGLAQVCRYLNLHFICVIDPKITLQNRRLIQAYGATLSLVSDADHVSGEYLQARLARVQELLSVHRNSFWPNQYANCDASDAHHVTMAEILSGVGGRLDYLFCATSTCGTLRGCAEYLREHSPATKAIAVDAVGSVIFGRTPRRRLIPGHGASTIPHLFDASLASSCVHVTDLECIAGCRTLLRDEALLVGGSSGAVFMAVQRALPDIFAGARCAAIFPDRGERYLETIFSDDWIEQHFSDSDIRILKETYAFR